jgi:ribosomal-protein-serine acetyltransferase
MFPYQIDREITLRLLEASDAEALFELTDSNRAYLRQWLPWLDFTARVEDSLYFIEATQRQRAQDNGYILGIWYGDRLVGIVGHHYLDRPNRSTQLGYWLGEEFQGRGIMTRAVRALIELTFNTWRLNRIEIRCATGNQPSCRLAERLGACLEGTARDAEWLYDRFVDHHVYSILAREWKELQKLLEISS